MSFHRWVYRRFFVADGNFKADHVQQKNVSDIWLSAGAGMFARQSEYESFLSSALERLTVSDLFGSRSRQLEMPTMVHGCWCRRLQVHWCRDWCREYVNLWCRY